ncbi:MAG: adenylate/guanylate cyclase domain-containing protein [Thermodesulfobacteriota bacterium]|nr:adenylate/guanylate cyclase domain-containing protein [Thermodesulfobacteriota bacterium]
MIIGEVLRRHGIINEDQLNHALDIQKNRFIEEGKVVPIGTLIVSLGYADEEAIIDAINSHYRISVTTLSDNIREHVKTLRGSFVERLPAPRMPIWLQLSITTMVLIILTATFLNFFILNRQKEQLYDKTLKIGLVSLNYFDSNARIPLLEDDLLQLNTLMRDATKVEGILYAVITDNDNMIKAHTDLSRIGTPLREFENVENVTKKGRNLYFNHTLPTGEYVLNISRPIMFKGKTLGRVHVGVSINFIRHLIFKEQVAIFLITLGVVLVGLLLAVGLGVYYSSPIQKLVMATREISRGNYRHRVVLNRKDELGNLARAFNKMSEELWRNSLMQESFGKYVGNDVLEMIMADPQKQWLKGRRNEATILFADIRGFTFFSEENEPEQVIEMLNEYFEISAGAILEQGGYVDKFMGDAVLGVFGIPVFHSNHVERAVQAALMIQENLCKAAKHGNALFTAVGIGIDTGVIVSGNIGSQDKMEYTVIGSSVNAASRLSGMAGSGETIISKNVYEQVHHMVNAEKLPARTIKGWTEPVETYKVVGIKPHLS